MISSHAKEVAQRHEESGSCILGWTWPNELCRNVTTIPNSCFDDPELD